MNWFWINMPLAAVFFGAWVGIPLWLVLKRPDRGAPRPAAQATVLARPPASAVPPTAAVPQPGEHPAAA